MNAVKPIPMRADTNDRIIRIREEDGLTRADLAIITGYSRSYVDNWLTTRNATNWREAPENAVRLLELETGRKRPSYVGRRLKALQNRKEE
jgi:transcriptional regulator with XRE-family HTH domain